MGTPPLDLTAERDRAEAELAKPADLASSAARDARAILALLDLVEQLKRDVDDEVSHASELIERHNNDLRAIRAELRREEARRETAEAKVNAANGVLEWAADCAPDLASNANQRPHQNPPTGALESVPQPPEMEAPS